MKIRCTVCGYEFEVADDATSAVCPACEAELDIPDDVEMVE
ncbi:MAG: rubredoxin [archaeon]|nr:rubredoxin [archaeon]